MMMPSGSLLPERESARGVHEGYIRKRRNQRRQVKLRPGRQLPRWPAAS